MKYLKKFKLFEENSFTGAAYSFVMMADQKVRNLSRSQIYATHNKEIKDKDRFVFQVPEFVIEYNGNTFKEVQGRKIPTSTIKIWYYGNAYTDGYQEMKDKLFNRGIPKKPEESKVEPDSILEKLPGIFGPDSIQRSYNTKILQSSFGDIVDGNFKDAELKDYRWLQVLPNGDYLQFDSAGATGTIDRFIYQIKKEINL